MTASLRTIVVATCLLATGISQGQNFPSPTQISVRGRFESPVGSSFGSGFVIDNDLTDGYASGADTDGGPDVLLPTGRAGSAFFQSGTPAASSHADALWYTSYFSTGVTSETEFTLGILDYRNGSISPGSGASSVDLVLTLALPGISLPNGLNPIVITSTLNFTASGLDAESIFITETLIPTGYRDDAGNPYFLELSFQDLTAGGSPSTASVFQVAEGDTGRTPLKGRFTTTPIPEPSSMLLGALGVLVLFRRHRDRRS